MTKKHDVGFGRDLLERLHYWTGMVDAKERARYWDLRVNHVVGDWFHSGKSRLPEIQDAGFGWIEQGSTTSGPYVAFDESGKVCDCLTLKQDGPLSGRRHPMWWDNGHTRTCEKRIKGPDGAWSDVLCRIAEGMSWQQGMLEFSVGGRGLPYDAERNAGHTKVPDLRDFSTRMLVLSWLARRVDLDPSGGVLWERTYDTRNGSVVAYQLTCRAHTWDVPQWRFKTDEEDELLALAKACAHILETRRDDDDRS